MPYTINQAIADVKSLKPVDDQLVNIEKLEGKKFKIELIEQRNFPPANLPNLPTRRKAVGGRDIGGRET